MRDRPDAVMIFAAGFGTRMGSLTQDRPKPMLEVGGQPLIDHALDLIRAAGIKTVVANLHFKPDVLAAHLAPKGVALSLEPERILETGGGLRQARTLLGSDPVFTLNSDAVWTGQNPLTRLAQAWNPQEMDALLMLLEPQDANGHTGPGDFLRDGDGRLSRGPGLIYSGAQIIKTDGLDAIREDVFSLNLLWDQMLTHDRLFGIVHKGGWCDVGRPEGIALAESLLQSAGDV
ncbi:nucleotidyltransferase family protein [Maritimibacter dapengensis]|uniref:Nucleotidyltransferase family protein n=1 Tax=Maritimibacter dapengensis TaxID=2836868 RepID=A0ABS6T6T9_9RHOB|nr:nucleotidyltransferase family protein [Maritimibacter dapengensis]MBV7380042.1 nucleotidyltransferase family protein [Maritimibacter dapengensis]